MAKSTAVINPNLGLYLDRPSIALGKTMLQDGLNFRIKGGKLTNLNLGWARFGSFVLNGPVALIDNLFLRSGTERLIFGTPSDLYAYNPAGSGSVSFITPTYSTGTVAASGTAVTGTGSTWTTNAKAGDEIHFGAANYRDPSGTWFVIDTVTDNTHIVLHTSAGTVGAGTAYTIRRKFTGAITDVWVSDTFVNSAATGEDEWFATNGLDFVVKWNGTANEVTSLSALGFTCKTLGVYNNMMLYGNLLQGGVSKPTDMINSDPGTPDNVTSGLSEQFRVHSGTDGILRFKKIGENVAIYSSNTVVLAQFVGDPLVFSFRVVTIDVGPVGPKAIAAFPDYHEFLGHDSQYQFDGASVKRIAKHVWREFLRQQDPTRIHRSFSHFDEENGDLLWGVPFTTDPGSGTTTSPFAKAAAEHYLEEVGQTNPAPVSLRSFPFTTTGYYTRQTGITWDQLTNEWQTYNFRWNDQFFFTAFPLNMAGSNDGKIYTFNTAQDADGVALPSFVKFGRVALADGRSRPLLARVYPFVTKFNNPMNVTIGIAEHAQGPVTATQTLSFDQTLPEGGHFVTPYRRGRFMDLSFGSDGPGQPWELSGYDMDIRSGGRR